MLFMKGRCLNVFELFDTLIGSYVIPYLLICSFDAFGEKVKFIVRVQTFDWSCI